MEKESEHFDDTILKTSMMGSGFKSPFPGILKSPLGQRNINIKEPQTTDSKSNNIKLSERAGDGTLGDSKAFDISPSRNNTTFYQSAFNNSL